MILAVSINNIVYYEMVNDNINKDIFKKFLINTLAKMEKKDINNSIFILDNCSVHCCKDLIEFMQKEKLKVLFTVPYQSCFNPIELCFRCVKNIIYKKIYLNIKSLKKDIIEILNGDKIKETLFKNFAETLLKYKSFIINNQNAKLNVIEKIN